MQLQVLDRKSKGSPTCYCEDCIRCKKDKGPIADSVDDQSNKPNKVVEKQQQPQRSRKTGVSCSSSSATSNNNLVRNSTPPAPQQSLSPCQSCKSAQDMVETSHNNCLRCNGNWSSSEHSQDCGYSSENNNGCCDTGSASSSLPSSPEGSEVACSDGFCNHEGKNICF